MYGKQSKNILLGKFLNQILIAKLILEPKKLYTEPNYIQPGLSFVTRETVTVIGTETKELLQVAGEDSFYLRKSKLNKIEEEKIIVFRPWTLFKSKTKLIIFDFF